MQIRIRVAIFVGLLVAASHSTAMAQINSAYYSDEVSYYGGENYYNPRGLITGCFEDPGPCWVGQATFDILMFDRSDAAAQTIVRDTFLFDFGPPTGVQTVLSDPLLDTKDLGFPVTAGFRFNLVLAGDDGCDFVVNYLGSAFSTSRVHDGTTAAFKDFDGYSQPTSGDPFRTTYASSLRSVELNSRTRRWSHFAPLAGLRFIQLEEDFDRDLADGSAYLVDTNVDNQLWGFQLGGEALLYDMGAARLQSTFKAGVFYNNTDLSTESLDYTATDPFTGLVMPVDGTQSFSGQKVAFFGEINVEYAYQVCRCLSIRAGYTAMWLDGVALAPDQIATFSLLARAGTFDYGTVLYHGSYVGFELTW